MVVLVAGSVGAPAGPPPPPAAAAETEEEAGGAELVVVVVVVAAVAAGLERSTAVPLGSLEVQSRAM